MRLAGAVQAVFAAIRIRTNPCTYARKIGVRMGRNVRLIGITGGTFGQEPYLVTLGDHVTITARVQFITHDGGVWVFRDELPDIDVVAPIVVGNNVFIGFGAILLPGITIGDNVVIGAGAVVTGDIPPNSVAAGLPARVLMSVDQYRSKVLASPYRFNGLRLGSKRAILEQHFHR